MPGSGFVELVGRLVEGMGQAMDAVRLVPEGVLLRTSDGFLYAFLEDPNQVSLDAISKLFAEVEGRPAHLVVLTPTRLPLALGQEVLRRGATLVEAQRFHELARGLGLSSLLGDAPRPAPTAGRGRLLPSAQQLDEILVRARTWQDWGVPALALRFYRQALALKPEFAPARTGVGRALLGLGLAEEADRAFDEVLSAHPTDRDARLGKAAVLGALGRTAEEVAAYRRIVEEDPNRPEARAYLLAALLDQKSWPEARSELEGMLANTPEDPRLRLLLGVVLEKTGDPSRGAEERAHARRLGLAYEREKALLEHLGLPVPPPPVSEPGPVQATPPTGGPEPAAAPPGRPRRSRRRARAAPRASASPSRKRVRGRKAK